MVTRGDGPGTRRDGCPGRESRRPQFITAPGHGRIRQGNSREAGLPPHRRFRGRESNGVVTPAHSSIRIQGNLKSHRAIGIEVGRHIGELNHKLRGRRFAMHRSAIRHHQIHPETSHHRRGRRRIRKAGGEPGDRVIPRQQEIAVRADLNLVGIPTAPGIGESQRDGIAHRFVGIGKGDQLPGGPDVHPLMGRATGFGRGNNSRAGEWTLDHVVDGIWSGILE